MFSLICLTWIGVALNAPLWYFILITLAACWNVGKLFSEDKKGD